jgi:hypothetical protein
MQGDRARQEQNHSTVEDQQRFDSYYSRWLTARRTGNRSETGSMEERMRDLMGRNSIPLSVQFSQIASESAGRYSQPNIPRFSGRDASDFCSYYARWQDYKRTNNRGRSQFLMESISEAPCRKLLCRSSWARFSPIYELHSRPNNSLNLLKPRLMQSRTAVVVPFDHRVVFVSLHNCAEFPRPLPEIAQTLNAISGIWFRLLWRRLGE